MTLVLPATLATRLGISAQDAKLPGAIAVSEAIAAAYIGAESLELTSRTEKIRPPRDRDSIEINKGPLTSLTTLSVDGTAQTVADFIAEYWGIRIDDPAVKFSADKTVTVTYQSGWENEAALPPAILEALLIIGQQAYTRDPTGRLLASRSIGDFSESWESSAQSGLNPIPITASSLLAKFRRPQL